MATATQARLGFKPILVQGNQSQRSLFKVIDISSEVTREQIETLLENLPMRFTLRRKGAYENLNEPIEVEAGTNIINIYPPRSRFLAGVSFQAWEFFNITSQMRVDNMMDADYRNGQLRCCVHFNPSILGVRNWPSSDHLNGEIEIDIFKYPKTRIAPIEVLRISKFDVLKLTDQIAGGERSLTLKQVEDFKDILLVSIEGMRMCYENEETDSDYSVRLYYADDFKSIAQAVKEKDNAKLLQAIEGLRISIRME